MSKAQQSRVEVFDFSDVKKAARTLYKAFDDDDVARYSSRHLENQPELKKQVDLELYEAYLYSHILKGLVVGIKGDDRSD